MIAAPLPPKRLLLFAALLLGLLIGACVALLGSQPWLGLRFAASPDGSLRITHVQGPALEAGLTAGRAIALHGGHGRRMALQSGDIIEEPDFHHQYRDYNAFLARQDNLSELLRSGRVGVETEAGITWIQPAGRALDDLPLIFWFQIVCGGIAWMVGASVIANSRERAARYYALTGAAFLLVTYTAAIYSARELALQGSLFRLLSVADHAGAFLFAAAFLGLLWLYPARLGNARVPHAILGIYLIVWIADTLQWVPDMNFGIRYPMLAGLATSFILAGLQWRRARQEPISRAALKWFLLTLTVGSAVFVLGVFGMQAMGHLPVIPQGFAFGFVLMMYLGMAIGMRRYRLFNLEPWWPQFWLWFLGGVSVLLIDLVLLRFLLIDSDIALVLAVALAGWLYFPMRQHLLRHALHAYDERLSELMPELIRISSAPLDHEALGEAWRGLLARAFRPISIDPVRMGTDEVHILDDGLRMCVPYIDDAGAFQLSHAEDGRRLFLPADLELARSLLDLMRQALSRQESYARGAREERERIAGDLHDDVGAKLLTLIHRVESTDIAERLRAILQDLRSLAASLEREPAPLGDALGDWRGEIADRCESAGVALDWQDAVMDKHLFICSVCRLGLERVLREAVTNALKHAQPARLMIVAEDTGVDINEEPEALSVGFSQFQAGAEVGRYLLARGYRRPAIIAAQLDPRSLERIDGFRRALAEAGVENVGEMLTPEPTSIALGGNLLSRLLAASPDRDAVFCVNDDLALGALFECQRRGLRVPGDLAIVGFNDLPYARLAVPSITSVTTPRYEIGFQAAHLMLRQLNGEPLERRALDLGFKLAARDSA